MTKLGVDEQAEYELLALHLHRDFRDGSWYAVRVERKRGTDKIRQRVVLEIDFDALRKEIYPNTQESLFE